MRNIIGIGFLGTVLLTGCVFLGDSFHKKELTSVTVTQKDNPGLSQDYRAIKSSAGSTYTLYLPNVISAASLVAKVEFQGLRAEYGGLPLPPDGKIRDLSSPQTLTISGPDDQTATYQIVVQYQKLVFVGFRFSDPSSGYSYGSIDSSGYLHTVWDGTTSLDIPTRPTQSIQVTLPESVTPTMIPWFSHNGARVEFRGGEVISGVTPIDTTTNQALTLVGADGTRQPVDLTFTYTPLSLASLGLWEAKNPSMRRNSVARINQTTKTIELLVPTNANSTALVVEFSHNGSGLLVGGVPVVSGTTLVDLSKDCTLTIQGSHGRTQDYLLHPSAVSPSSTKELTSWAAYSSTSKLVPYRPDSSDRKEYTTTAGGVDQLTLTGSATSTNRAAVYLALVTSGWKATVAGKVLTQGELSTETYHPNNFVDFTNPVQLTITAEDLSTRTITLTLVLR